MSNPVRIALFMIIATVFNITLTALCFAVFLVFVFFLISKGVISDKDFSTALPIIIVAAIALAFVLYRKLLKWYLKKYPMEEMKKEY
jgi:hypothetical protein